MYSKICEKTYEILRSEITFLMDLYSVVALVELYEFWSKDSISAWKGCHVNHACISAFLLPFIGHLLNTSDQTALKDLYEHLSQR